MIVLTMTNTVVTIFCPRVSSLRPKRYVVTAAIAEKGNGDAHDHVPYPRTWSSLEYVLTPTIANMLPSVNDVTNNST